jgi:hypothetical protein
MATSQRLKVGVRPEDLLLWIVSQWPYSGPFEKEKGSRFLVTPCIKWWAVSGSNRGPTD